MNNHWKPEYQSLITDIVQHVQLIMWAIWAACERPARPCPLPLDRLGVELRHALPGYGTVDREAPVDILIAARVRLDDALVGPVANVRRRNPVQSFGLGDAHHPIRKST